LKKSTRNLLNKEVSDQFIPGLDCSDSWLLSRVMPKFPPARLTALDYAHRGITLSLFAITCAGAYTLGEGAYNILKKRYFSAPAIADGKKE